MARSAQLARLQKRMAAIPKAVKEAVQPALQKSGQELVSRMQQLAPVDTGVLRDSITMTPAGQSTPPYSQPGGSQVVPENAVMVTAGGTDVRYPHLVEYGVLHRPATPFFWPAYRLSKKRITSRVKRAISKAVKEHWVK
jgi:HK97 gp10 family phage protein